MKERERAQITLLRLAFPSWGSLEALRVKTGTGGAILRGKTALSTRHHFCAWLPPGNGSRVPSFRLRQ